MQDLNTRNLLQVSTCDLFKSLNICNSFILMTYLLIVAELEFVYPY